MVIFRVIEEWGRGITQFQSTRLGILLLYGLKIHVLPVSAAAVLHLAGHWIHARLDVERAGQIHKEDVTASAIGHTRAPYAHWSLGNVQGVLFILDRDVVAHPSHKFRGIGLELSRCCGIKGILQLTLEGRSNHLVFHSLAQLATAGIESILKNSHRNVSHILVVQSLQDAQDAIGVVAVLVGKIQNGLPVATGLD